jgi:hypothetical protein
VQARSLWRAVFYLATYWQPACTALYTLYYAALLLAAHALWAIVRLRQNLRALSAALLGGYVLIVPALPALAALCACRVWWDMLAARCSRIRIVPLGPLAYVERHLVAFTAGHIQWTALPDEWLALAPATFAICAIILGLVLHQTLRRRQTALSAQAPAAPSPAAAALWTWLLAPVLLGWLISLRLPFFPEGGERLLLIVLPYLLLLLALGIDHTWNVAHLGKLAAAALAFNALIGILAFYTTPRYAAGDYRSLLRQVQQQGADGSTLLAIFPWQIGYWRAYAPQGADAGGTQPLLLSDTAAAWSPAVAAAIDQALEGGALWFPEPLTFGSSLPHEIEQYLAQSAVNMENRWYDATRLTAWSKLPLPVAEPVEADFGAVRLQGAAIAPAAAQSANEAVAVALEWATPLSGDGPAQPVNVSLRLQDAAGHVWSSREYRRDLPPAGATLSETVGLIIPFGLPPGAYQVAASVQTAGGEPLTIAGSDAVAAPVGALEVTQPPVWPSATRLPIQHMLDRPVSSQGLALLGYSGPSGGDPQLAGTELAATLFLTNQAGEPPERQLYLSLLDQTGAGVAGYEGWPLPAYPTSAWPQDALVQVPAAFYLPGSLASGDYRLVAGLLDPATGSKTPPAEIATIVVRQRTGSFSRPTPSQPLAGAPQLGTHTRPAGLRSGRTAGRPNERDTVLGGPAAPVAAAPYLCPSRRAGWRDQGAAGRPARHRRGPGPDWQLAARRVPADGTHPLGHARRWRSPACGPLRPQDPSAPAGDPGWPGGRRQREPSYRRALAQRYGDELDVPRRQTTMRAVKINLPLVKAADAGTRNSTAHPLRSASAS